MMSVNWSWTKRMPFAFARLDQLDAVARPRTVRPPILPPCGLPGASGRSRPVILCATHETRRRWLEWRKGTSRGEAAAPRRVTDRYRPDLCILHNSERDGERQPELRVGETPAGERLDPADAIGDRVAVHAERGGRLVHATVVEERPQRRQALRAGCRPGPSSSGSRSARARRSPSGRLCSAPRSR